MKSLCKDLGKKLFSFAIIGDTHINQGEDECNSVFIANKLANRRMRYVVNEINKREDLSFVIHLGDLVHPVPAVEDLYLKASEIFKKQINKLNIPAYLVAGNHDVGDKPYKWKPTPTVCDEYLKLYERTFGEQYYSFEKENVHFIIVNSEIINSDFESEKKQKIWLEKELEENIGKRIFISIHYPPFMHDTGENENYDNIAEPGRSWFLGLIEKYEPEVVFAGHVHNFWFNRYKETDIYILPSTSFIRLDYSQMFKCEQLPEFHAGRNDFPKLGYFVVHVYENDHVFHMVRTNGNICEIDDSPDAEKEINSFATLENPRAPLGFDLRQSWAETFEIAPGGAGDEFDRKKVRNDYPLLSLWEMGVKKLRVPLSDLRNNETVRRMRQLKNKGFEFTLFSFHIPTESDFELIKNNNDIFVAWEITFPLYEKEVMADFFDSFSKISSLPIYIGKFWENDDLIKLGNKYNHVINHGFTPGDKPLIADMFTSFFFGKNVKGLVFRVNSDDSPWDNITAIKNICDEFGLAGSVHLRMTGVNPAILTADDLWTANHLAEAMAAAVTMENISVYSDTLGDVDRGYFPRNGVIDGRCNPRMGLRIVKYLYGVLNYRNEKLTPVGKQEYNYGKSIVIQGVTESYLLFLPLKGIKNATIKFPEDWSKKIIMNDLEKGIVSEITISDNNNYVIINDNINPVIFSYIH